MVEEDAGFSFGSTARLYAWKRSHIIKVVRKSAATMYDMKRTLYMAGLRSVFGFPSESESKVLIFVFGRW